MRLIYEPKVYLVVRPQLDNYNFMQFKDDEGIPRNTVPLPDTKDSEAIPEIAGRLCYLSFNNPRPGGNEAYLKHILESGHGSVLEHSNFGFVFTGVSRSLTHELVRHRAGFAYSQLSQRYVDESDVAFVVPPELREEVLAAENYIIRIDQTSEPADPWHGLSFGRRVMVALSNKDMPECSPAEMAGLEWLEGCQLDLQQYASCAAYAQNKIWSGTITDPNIAREYRKRARQTARSVLPNCTETKIFVTGNVRAWRHFIEMRGSKHAEVEIRRLAYKVWDILKTEAIHLFMDYTWTMNEDGTPADVSTPYRKV